MLKLNLPYNFSAIIEENYSKITSLLSGEAPRQQFTEAVSNHLTAYKYGVMIL